MEAAGGGVIRIQAVTHSPDSTWVNAEVLVSCSHHKVEPGGLPLQDVEPFTIHIPAGFPFEQPWVSTPHTRFAGYAHVPWQRGHAYRTVYTVAHTNRRHGVNLDETEHTPRFVPCDPTPLVASSAPLRRTCET